MPSDNAAFALALTPEKAIEFLKTKKAILNKLDEEGFKSSAAARATVIANLSNLEMTKDIYDSMIEAKAQGQPFGEWKKNLLGVFQKKGWVAGYDKGQGEWLLADPKTGEYFGTPRRLELIFRTNMQAAYSAQRYQHLRDNVDNRPYWQYSAVNDSRTRPSHSAMHGLVYRYDDPFWATFYPPNGFNCRCTVIALSSKDIERQALAVSRGETRLVSDYPRDDQQKTTAFKASENRMVIADKGFDYNIGRLTYRPNLDLYPEALAHQFAQREMSGGEFHWGYQYLEQALTQLKAQQGQTGKLSTEAMLAFRHQLSRHFKFAAGRLTEENQALLALNTATVWLSDDTLVKQMNSRLGQDFGLAEYALLPDLFFEPDTLWQEGKNYSFVKNFKTKRLLGVLKYLANTNELFLVSVREIKQPELEKMKTTKKVIK